MKVFIFENRRHYFINYQTIYYNRISKRIFFEFEYIVVDGTYSYHNKKEKMLKVCKKFKNKQILETK